jgi:hypothetical protein
MAQYCHAVRGAANGPLLLLSASAEPPNAWRASGVEIENVVVLDVDVDCV